MMDDVYPKPQNSWPETPFYANNQLADLDTSGKGNTLLEDHTTCPSSGERDTMCPIWNGFLSINSGSPGEQGEKDHIDWVTQVKTRKCETVFCGPRELARASVRVSHKINWERAPCKLLSATQHEALLLPPISLVYHGNRMSQCVKLHCKLESMKMLINIFREQRN